MSAAARLLVLLAGKAYGARPVHGIVRLGRHETNDIQLEGDSVSRFHAIVVRGRDGACYVEDLDSLNGTIVLGRRVERQQLEPGASFMVGDFECRLTLDESSEDLTRQLEETRPREPFDGSPSARHGRDAQWLGSSAAALALDNAIEEAALVNTDVLILGETGSGKTFAARRIHERSARARGPFMEVNCAAVPESLAESELFGHVAGAFTGATRRHIGKFEQAQEGTIFLDEIGEMPLAVQAKLLKVLDDKCIMPVGWQKPTPIQVDLRIIAATHRDTERAIAENRLRKDLYYRLARLTLRVPALRERKDDIELFARQILIKIAAEVPAAAKLRLSHEACRALSALELPGNLRELEHFLWRGVLAKQRLLKRGPGPDLHATVIEPIDMDIDASAPAVQAASAGADADTGDHPSVRLEDVKLQHMQRVLDHFGGVVRDAAKALGISPQTLHTELSKGRLIRRPK